MTELPTIPVIHYFYCPTCEEMKDFLIDQLENYSKGYLAYCCDECDAIYALPEKEIPRDEREAYKITVRVLDSMLHYRDAEKIELMETVQGMRAYEIMANSVVYANIKAFTEIKDYIKKKDYKNASKDCVDMIKFLKRNKEKARKNELVKELVSGKVKGI